MGDVAERTGTAAETRDFLDDLLFTIFHDTQLFRTHEAPRNSHQPIIKNCSRTSAVQMDLGADT